VYAPQTGWSRRALSHPRRAHQDIGHEVGHEVLPILVGRGGQLRERVLDGLTIARGAHGLDAVDLLALQRRVSVDLALQAEGRIGDLALGVVVLVSSDDQPPAPVPLGGTLARRAGSAVVCGFGDERKDGDS
jgi:hypothetical protein